MKAYLKNYRQSPRKVRLVADLVRGKSYDRAMLELSFLPKRASGAVAKLIASAAANAEHNFKMEKSTLMIKEITVDQGITLKRSQPRSRGMATRINKRTSNIAVTLAQGNGKKNRKGSAKEIAQTVSALKAESADEAKKGKKSSATKKTEGKSTAKTAKKTTVKKTTKKVTAKAKK